MSDDGVRLDNTIVIKCTESEREEFADGVKSVSAKGRRLVVAANEAEEELGLKEDIEKANIMVLETYKTALEKNLQTIQAQLDQIDKKLEEYHDDEEDEILLTVNLEFERHHL